MIRFMDEVCEICSTVSNTIKGDNKDDKEEPMVPGGLRLASTESLMKASKSLTGKIKKNKALSTKTLDMTSDVGSAHTKAVTGRLKPRGRGGRREAEEMCMNMCESGKMSRREAEAGS